MSTYQRECLDESATDTLGADLAHALLAVATGGLLVTLRGDLGAGKTTLVRALLRALGVRGRIKSPSYALVEPYAIGENDIKFKQSIGTHAYHIDLYRFSSPDEWDDAGLRDVLDAHALCLVEWPEKAPQLLRRADIDITLTPAGEGRVVRIEGSSPAGAAVIQQLASSPKDA